MSATAPRKKPRSWNISVKEKPAPRVMEHLSASRKDDDVRRVSSAISRGEALQTLAMEAFGGLGAIEEMIENGEVGNVNECADPESVIFSGLWTDNDSAYRNYYLSVIAGFVLRVESQHRDARCPTHKDIVSQYETLGDILARAPMDQGNELLSRVQIHTAHVLGEHSDAAQREQERHTRIIGSVLARVQQCTNVSLQKNG